MHKDRDTDTQFAKLTLDANGTEGDTIATFENSRINVFGGIQGEEVIARIVRYRRRKRWYSFGVVADITKPSPHRVSPPCPYFGPCSGCQWQHIAYDHQLYLKHNSVRTQFDKHQSLKTVTINDTLSATQQFGYRNHARFTVRHGGKLGFVNRITRRFIAVNNCMIMASKINNVLGNLFGHSQETSQISVRHGINTSDVLIQPELHNKKIHIASGQTHYNETLLGKTFRIASPSFFQVNTSQAEVLVKLVLEYLKLDGTETLIDAYAGVGIFAVLAAPCVKRVIAVEDSEAAIKDAAVNMLGIDNIQVLQGRTEQILSNLDSRPDVIILDPPRAGCAPAALQSVAMWKPSQTVYVSCDPTTLARDLDILTRLGLQVVTVQPVDMFPQTHHVECVALLQPI